ncbi:MAG: DUF6673 family protein [Ruminococcus sp.]
MIINNVELPDIDTADADVMEHYEKAIEEFKSKIQKVDTKNLKPSQVIREECHIVFELFNELFGGGTDRKLFGDKCNLNMCFNAFDQLISSVKENDKSNAEKILALAPQPNRQQRRNQNKGKKKKHYNNRPQLVNKS